MGQTDRVDTLGANGGEGFASCRSSRAPSCPLQFQLGVLQPTPGRSPHRLEPDAGLPFLRFKHACNPFNENLLQGAKPTNNLFHRSHSLCVVVE